MMPAGIAPQPDQAGSIPGPSHAPAGAPNMGPADMADMGDVMMADGRKAKRELSQSKRAAQNRAAQVSRIFCFFAARECQFVRGAASLLSPTALASCSGCSKCAGQVRPPPDISHHFVSRTLACVGCNGRWSTGQSAAAAILHPVISMINPLRN